MDAAFLSHVVLWVIGGLSLLAGLGTIGAFFSLGRSGYRKD